MICWSFELWISGIIFKSSLKPMKESPNGFNFMVKKLKEP